MNPGQIVAHVSRTPEPMFVARNVGGCTCTWMPVCAFGMPLSRCHGMLLIAPQLPLPTPLNPRPCCAPAARLLKAKVNFAFLQTSTRIHMLAHTNCSECCQAKQAGAGERGAGKGGSNGGAWVYFAAPSGGQRCVFHCGHLAGPQCSV